MKKVLAYLTISVISMTMTFGQSYKNWDCKIIDKFYEKVSVKSGTLSEDGKKISYIFVPTSIKPGTYEVTIVDYKNDLFEIKGTGYYVKFWSLVCCWGFIGKTGVLEVGAWSSKFYIRP
jgi:hypothetical protein